MRKNNSELIFTKNHRKSWFSYGQLKIYVLFVSECSKSKVTPLTLVDVHLNWLNWFHFLIPEEGLLVTIDCIILLSPFLDVTRIYVNSFCSCTARLWNFLPIECFSLTNDISGFEARINRHLLTLGLKRFWTSKEISCMLQPFQTVSHTSTSTDQNFIIGCR